MNSPTGAVFSRCRSYRYLLWRRWDDSRLTVNFIGLNPSTADETQDDPTMRRCRQFAQDWGYGAFLMTNLFAFRATKPTQLKMATDPVGPENNKWIIEAANHSRMVVFVWGTHGPFQNRDDTIISLLEGRGYCISLTKHGHPAHPLYLKKNLRPVLFSKDLRAR